MDRIIECKDCKVEKLENEFYEGYLKKSFYRCKSCTSIFHKVKYKNLTKEKKLEYKEVRRKWIKKDILNVRLITARARSKKMGYEFDLDLKVLYDIFNKQKGLCAYTGIPFNNDIENFSTSLDRINPLKGYIKENVQLVLYSINIMKNNFEEEFFIELCKKVYLNSIN